MTAALAGLVLALVAGQAPAEGLRWQAAAGCPDALAVTGAIERRLGRALAVGEARVDATVVAEGRGYRLVLRLEVGARGEAREVVDESCAALAQVVALRVAAAVEGPMVPEPPAGGGVVEGEIAGGEIVGGEIVGGEIVGGEIAGGEIAKGEIAKGEIARGEIVGPGDGVSRAGTREAPVPSRRSRGPGGVLRLQGGGELGAVPGVTGAVGVAGGLLWRRLRVELQGVFLAPRTVSREGVALRVSLLAGSLHGCWRGGRGALEAPLCGGVELGGLRGAAARAATGLLVTLQVGQGLVWHVSPRVSVSATLQLVVAPRRPSFELQNARASRELFAPSPVSGRVIVGVELRLGDPW